MLNTLFYLIDYTKNTALTVILWFNMHFHVEIFKVNINIEDHRKHYESIEVDL